MNPDQRESLERKTPHRYGGLGLVSIYVHECQTYCFVSIFIVQNQLLKTAPFGYVSKAYSTVTDFARLRGWSTSVPLSTAT